MNARNYKLSIKDLFIMWVLNLLDFWKGYLLGEMNRACL